MKWRFACKQYFPSPHCNIHVPVQLTAHVYNVWMYKNLQNYVYTTNKPTHYHRLKWKYQNIAQQFCWNHSKLFFLSFLSHQEKEEETHSKTEVINIGDVLIEWHPLPTYCHKCLFRSNLKRAAELTEGTIVSTAKNSNLGSLRTESLLVSLPLRNGKTDVENNFISDSATSHQMSDSTSSYHSKNSSKTWFCLLSQTDRIKKDMERETSSPGNQQSGSLPVEKLILSTTKSRVQTKVSDHTLSIKNDHRGSLSSGKHELNTCSFKTESSSNCLPLGVTRRITNLRRLLTVKILWKKSPKVNLHTWPVLKTRIS